MSPALRSVLLSVIFGMMAAAFLHQQGVVDLGFGFPPGGFEEGVSLALVGGVGGYAMLMAFRFFRSITRRTRGD